ncbi:MAG: hypothetical protein Q8P20_09910 [bacterium]|nr:hypothetical protein [bacterium]
MNTLSIFKSGKVIATINVEEIYISEPVLVMANVVINQKIAQNETKPGYYSIVLSDENDNRLQSKRIRV